MIKKGGLKIRLSASFALCLLAALLLAGTALGEVSREGLVGEWHFDEGVGNVVKDSSGNGNDGTIYGATWVDGKFGKALSFDGVDDYLLLSDRPILNIIGDVTVDMWAKKRNDPNAVILSKGAQTISKIDVPSAYYLGFNGRNAIFATFEDTSGVNYPIIGPKVTNSSFFHYAYIRSGSIQKLYMDGIEVASAAFTGTPGDTTGISLFIGAFRAENSFVDYFNGIIDEVRIYNRALSAEEVKASYEGVQTVLSIIKSVSPTSIKQGQTTTITLTVENTGSTEIKDIEIADTTPKGLKIIGETTKAYASLSPKDKRQFQYSAQINEAGTLNLGMATASYADNNGNYKKESAGI